MTKSLYLASLHLHIEVREDWVGTIRLVRTEEVLAAKNVDVMSLLGTAFCQQQIVIAILLVNMRAFGISSPQACAQMVYITQLTACFHINLTDLDVALLP